MGICHSDNNKLSDISMSRKELSKQSTSDILIKSTSQNDMIENVLDSNIRHYVASAITPDKLKQMRRLDTTVKGKSTIAFKNVSNGEYELSLPEINNRVKKSSSMSFMKTNNKLFNSPDSQSRIIETISKKKRDVQIDEIKRIMSDKPIVVKNRASLRLNINTKKRDSVNEDRSNSSKRIDFVKEKMREQKQLQILGYIPDDYNIAIHSLKK